MSSTGPAFPGRPEEHRPPLHRQAASKGCRAEAEQKKATVPSLTYSYGTTLPGTRSGHQTCCPERISSPTTIKREAAVETVDLPTLPDGPSPDRPTADRNPEDQNTNIRLLLGERKRPVKALTGTAHSDPVHRQTASETPSSCRGAVRIPEKGRTKRTGKMGQDIVHPDFPAEERVCSPWMPRSRVRHSCPSCREASNRSRTSSSGNPAAGR